MVEFTRIKKGTQRQEVVELIGKGYERDTFPVLPDGKAVKEEGKYCISYSKNGKLWPLFDFAWIAIGVCYDDNDMVTRTYKIPVYN